MRHEAKNWLLSINDLGHDIYGGEWRISTVLEKYCFSEAEVSLLKTDGLREFLLNLEFALQSRLIYTISSQNNIRFYDIVCSRYGLFDHPKETLQHIGERMGISRERVRQLQEKTVRRLKSCGTFEVLIVISACHTLGLPPLTRLSSSSDEKADNGAKKRTYGKNPFSLPPELREAVVYYSEPVFLSAFVKGINKLVNREALKMKRIYGKNITAWLVENDYLLVQITKNGSSAYKPTSLGESIGILEQRYDWMFPDTPAQILYNINAQHFIVDHLDEIVACTRKTNDSKRD